MAGYRRPIVQQLLLTAYYLAIIFALITLYGQGDVASTEFVYQGF
jgi:hypothetical protein